MMITTKEVEGGKVMMITTKEVGGWEGNDDYHQRGGRVGR